MPKATFRLDPESADPACMGILAIRLLRQHLGLELAPAKKLIDRALVDREEVVLEFPTHEAAARFVEEFNALDGPTRFQAALGEP